MIIATEVRGDAGRQTWRCGDPDPAPASMTHAIYAPEERAAHGFTNGLIRISLIRISVGLEDHDLQDDLLGSLDHLNNNTSDARSGRI